MFVFGDLVVAVARILDTLLEIYKWIVIITALISWVNPDPYNPIVRFLYSVTEPVLRPVRRLIGYRLGPVDISPLAVILVIIFLQSFVVRSLIKLGFAFGGG
ncbi:MAG: YggT family protein [Nitrospiraceae bacterium]|nr:YggT family protein [Nitrospiraceae bacterium]